MCVVQTKKEKKDRKCYTSGSYMVDETSAADDIDKKNFQVCPYSIRKSIFYLQVYINMQKLKLSSVRKYPCIFLLSSQNYVPWWMFIIKARYGYKPTAMFNYDTLKILQWKTRLLI